MYLMKQEPNELRPELLSTLSVNPFKSQNSASRDQMLSGHLGQHLVIEGGEERWIQSGAEARFGEMVFNVKMPTNGVVLHEIVRYPRTYEADSIAFSPQTILIYEDAATKEVGYVNLPRYCAQHPYFGFEYKPWPAMGKRRPGTPIAEGEIFLNSPAVKENGGYGFGRQLNVAFMTHPAVAEDGIAICRDVLEHFAYRTYETRSVEFGSDTFPVNIYGDERNYKPFPDIGETVRPDGLLVALRSYDELLAPVEQSIHDVRELDNSFDYTTYVGGGGRVIDIRVYRQSGVNQPNTPTAMEVQVSKYERAKRQFYQEILDVYHKLKRESANRLRITPQFNALVREAISVVGHNTTNPKDVIRTTHRQNPIDEWRVEFVIEYRNIPKKGAKFTDLHGGKGVVCQILEPEDMPVDQNGVRADVIMDGGATVNRMNYGRMSEHYFNAAGRDLTREIARTLGVEAKDRELYKKLTQIENSQPQLIDAVWQRLMSFYEFMSPRLHAMFIDGRYTSSRLDHLSKIIKDEHLYLFYPTDNQPEPTNQVRLVREYYRPHKGPVTYRGNSGQKVTTRDNVLIGAMYIILLEKVGDDWSAVSSAKFQHFGVPAQVSINDKYSRPTRNNPVRAMGESEVRIYSAYCGSHVTADLLDRSNNVLTHKHMLKNVLNAEKPTAIHSIVDRKEVPLGGSKPLQLIKHIGKCGGFEFIKEDPTNP